MKKKLACLKYLQAFFYLAFLSLWFKNNFPPLKNIRLSYLLPLGLLVLTTLLRLYLKYRSKKLKFRLRLNKKVFISLILLVMIATLIRIPYLFYSGGLMESDKAISALMGKHISEGKLPPIFWYGQLRQGSLKEHFNALMFKIFGYSIPIFMLIPLLFYLGFLTVQFISLKDIFSYNFSLAVSIFYCLPMGILTESVIWDSAGGLPLILFLGSLIVYLSYLIHFKSRENLASILGFLMGLAFFAHQIAIFFLVTAFLLIIAKFKFHWKKYLNLLFYAFLGCFPIILHEFFSGFILTRFMFSGEKGILTWTKIKKTLEIILSLISHKNNIFGYLCLISTLLGIAAIISLSLKKRKFLSENIYVLFSVIFLLVYFSSSFSNLYWIRYLTPLYFVLPVLLLSGFLLIKPKIKYVFMATLILSLFLLNNLKGELSIFTSVKISHFNSKNIVKKIQHTQKKYWQGNFWTAYYLTAVSKENIIIDSYTVKRYFPYWLFYYNQGQNNNFIFLTGELNRYRRENLINLLNKFNIKAKIEKIGKCWLVYDIEGEVFPKATLAPIPEEIPRLKLVESKISRGYLNLLFKNGTKSEISGFRLNAEIPGYSSATKPFSSEKNQIKIKLPLPDKKAIKMIYHLNYLGLRIPSTEKEMSYSFPLKKPAKKRKKKEEITYLSGFGPRRLVHNKKLTICGKEIKLEINKILKKKNTIHIYLNSPIEFDHPYWYGDFHQHVSAFLNDVYLTETELKPEDNTLILNLKNFRPKKTGNILSLKFRYALPLPQTPFWKVACFLEKVEIK